MIQYPDGDEVLIALNGVSYAYPTHLTAPVLREIDLEVHRGQYLLICGSSGSGKSSLVRTFNGLIPHFYGGNLSGRVRVGDRCTQETSVADLFHEVGIVFQNPKAQLFNTTVAREILFGMESLGLDRAEMQTRLELISHQMGLEAMLQRNPQSLSGGEQQWVAIAAILVLKPHIIILDEPMANLDTFHIRRLRNLLTDLRNQGLGIVVCEHRMRPTLPDADRVLIIQQGELLLQGPVDQAAINPLWPEQDIELPLAVRIGRKMGLQPLPRTIPALAAHKRLGPLPHPLDTVTVQSGMGKPAGRPVVKTENLNFHFNNQHIIRDVSFTLFAGQCTALVGANGAGKTTLVKLINGLLKPSSGRIEIMGQSIADRKAWQVADNVGTAFQNPNSQFFKLTVEEEILVGPKVQNCLDDQWIAELVTIFKLEQLLDRAPFKLSGGEKKRVAFAAALAAKPQVLVLDEPTAGQDSSFRRALIQCLHRLAQQGAAVLVVTHALDFLESLTDRWLIMAQGRLIADTTPHAIMADDNLMQRAMLMPTETFQWKRLNTDLP